MAITQQSAIAIEEVARTTEEISNGASEQAQHTEERFDKKAISLGRNYREGYCIYERFS